MISYGKTDIGQVRSENQDFFGITEGEDWVSAVVCDGMGGAAGGSIASELAVCVYTDELCKAVSLENEDPNRQFIKNAMINAVAKANTEVFRRASSDSELVGMGTTLVACFTHGKKTGVVNVGDSRLYGVTSDGLKQITKDHSYVQYLVDMGRITEEEALNHPKRNIILKALGIGSVVEPDFFWIEGFDGVLLCSDGLINYLDEAEIVRIVLSDATAEEKVKLLIDGANENGGGDNITVVLLMREANNG